MSRPSLGFIGAGKVGCTLARLLQQASYRVVAVHSRTPESAERLARQVQAQAVNTPDEVIARADLTLLTVPDDEISTVVGLIVGEVRGKAVVHTSGVHDATALAVLAQRGAMVTLGSLHPAFPFADVESSVANLPGATFALEAEAEPLRSWLHKMVLALHGRAMVIAPGQKAAYHAALAIASNYTVTLYAAAEKLLLALGADRETADGALNVLLAATIENLRVQGVPAALTGPLVRGDVGTVAAHLTALEHDRLLHDTYSQLARLTLPLLEARGVPTSAIEQLLNVE
ncbi:MAG: DUF2520 domain-containing protein [Burkholderiales bacterium]|nr:DUF2520 domain-containing protein [Anaerolineae bacterium]